MRIVFQDFRHIIVAGSRLEIDLHVRVTQLRNGDHIAEHVAFGFQTRLFKIAQQNLDRGLILLHLRVIRMDEADPAFGRFRQNVAREKRHKITRRIHRIDQHAFRRTGMRIRLGVPSFVADVAELLAIHRIGELRSEAFNVEFFDAATNLFIRRKGDGNRAVLKLRILAQGIHHRQNFSDARFIIRP